MGDKFYRVSVAITVMAQNEQDAQARGVDWIQSCDGDCFDVEPIADVDAKVEWLVAMDNLMCGAFTGWEERYAGMRKLYQQRWGVLVGEERWDHLMTAVDRFGETIQDNVWHREHSGPCR